MGVILSSPSVLMSLDDYTVSDNTYAGVYRAMNVYNPAKARSRPQSMIEVCNLNNSAQGQGNSYSGNMGMSIRLPTAINFVSLYCT